MNAEDAAELVAEQYGESKIRRGVLGANRGYYVTNPNGAEHFEYTFSSAIRKLMEYLGHKGDRDILVMGDGRSGEQW